MANKDHVRHLLRRVADDIPESADLWPTIRQQALEQSHSSDQTAGEALPRTSMQIDQRPVASYTTRPPL